MCKVWWKSVKVFQSYGGTYKQALTFIDIDLTATILDYSLPSWIFKHHRIFNEYYAYFALFQALNHHLMAAILNSGPPFWISE